MVKIKELLDYYNNYDEDIRLQKSKLHNIEYLTTISYIEKIISPSSEILDVSAGTGIYSFYLANKGHDVTAGDVVPRFVDIMTEKKKKTSAKVNIYLGDVRDLSMFSKNSFDVVLCMGPIYHLKEDVERRRAIDQCTKVLKKNGILAVAYINKYASYVSNFRRTKDIKDIYNIEAIMDKGYYTEGKEGCFYFSSPEEIENLMKDYNVNKIYNLGTDGIGYLIGERILNLNEEEYKHWLEYHLRTCENESLLGYSLHGLFIGEKLD